ncbi:MAG: hypothetical protein AAFO94_03905 [Bacteroidota bacterium]
MKNIILAGLAMLLAIHGHAQSTTDRNKVDVDTEKIAAFRAFFNNPNVGNLHVYAPKTETVSTDYYFSGTAIPRGYFDLIDPFWRMFYSDDMKAFAVYTLKGTVDNNPYYLIRFESPGVRNTLDLFELSEGKLHHKKQLAAYWCMDQGCVQKDSWIQDMDGDTQFDILKKVRMVERNQQGEFWSDDPYHIFYKQLSDGSFEERPYPQSEISDYIMESEK